MDVGTVLSVAQSLFAALKCSELREICSMLGYKSELDDLQGTVSTIRAVLRDADSKGELSHEAKLWIEELKDVVFEADDLLDEFVTLGEKQQLIQVGKVSKKVRLLFSRFSPLTAYNMSRTIKKIRNKFDSIAGNHSQIGFTFDHHQPTKRSREETCSYIHAGSIIGREDDVENIIGILLDSNVDQHDDVSILPIVGIGGLGKTALAQLVYNDERVTGAFPLRMWTCVSDQDCGLLDVKQILGKLLASLTGQNHDGFTMDKLQRQLREHLSGSKFLIVLDDVWTEDRSSWVKLLEYLLGSDKGSWIVVTTRSRQTARIMGDAQPYELQGLSEENSLYLFTRMAFGSEQLPDSYDDELVKIGQQIVQGCARVPLAIRVVGSLLYGQDKYKWLSLLEAGLTSPTEGQNDIMPILKLSYHHLQFPLKSCFRYCALFPKDFEIDKKMLINLWLAQGYVVPLYEGQRIEDTAEEYFSTLLQRCFIQDVKQDEYGEIISCKIHDLMHDVAQSMAGKEICITNSMIAPLDKKVRHLTQMRSETAQYSFTTMNIRSYLRAGNKWCQDSKMDYISLKALLENCLPLRALDLSHQNLLRLPSSIGKMIHLRYLDISWNSELKVLPKSITKLHNLQTLGLRECRSLKSLPKDLSHKLVKLRVLDIQGCSMLTCMPRDMSKLTCLHSLTYFVVGEAKGIARKQWFDWLQDLKSFKNLKGHLEIKFICPQKGVNDEENGKGEGEYLMSKEHLNHVSIKFRHDEVNNHERVDFEEETVLEELLPHSNLKGLQLWGYDGTRLSSWARGDRLVTFLPNLMKLQLSNCGKLEQLPCLENLIHLKVLGLESILNLEYMVMETNDSTTSKTIANFFPSLEELRLEGLPKLEGWWREFESSKLKLQCLSQLKSLVIHRCPKLTSVPPCPRLKYLTLWNFNAKLEIMGLMTKKKNKDTGNWSCILPKLRKAEVDNAVWLNLLPMEVYECLSELRIEMDDNLESLTEIEEVVLKSCSSCLRTLITWDCPKLRSVSGGLERLTMVEKLSMSYIPNLALKEERGDGLPWKSLFLNLRSLRLHHLPQLVNLPPAMQYLAALQTLQIWSCKRLESLPTWMPKLTSLEQLELRGCSSGLNKRCRHNPIGEDWPSIQHIPCIVVDFFHW